MSASKDADRLLCGGTAPGVAKCALRESMVNRQRGHLPCIGAGSVGGVTHARAGAYDDRMTVGRRTRGVSTRLPPIRHLVISKRSRFP